jgi:hypothetical protein
MTRTSSRLESRDWVQGGLAELAAQQVNTLLEEARSTRSASRARRHRQHPLSTSRLRPPYYRCVEAKPGKALIATAGATTPTSGSAPITVKDGAVELAEFDKWSPLKKAFIPTSAPAPGQDKLPLDRRTATIRAPEHGRSSPGSNLPRRPAAFARGQGRHDVTMTTTPREVVGTWQVRTALELSEEAQRVVQEAEARAAGSRAACNQALGAGRAADGDGQQGSRSTPTSKLAAAPKSGSDFDEARLRRRSWSRSSELMLADDGEPARPERALRDGRQQGGRALALRSDQAHLRRVAQATRRARSAWASCSRSPPTRPRAKFEVDEEGKARSSTPMARRKTTNAAEETSSASLRRARGREHELSTDREGREDRRASSPGGSPGSSAAIPKARADHHRR